VFKLWSGRSCLGQLAGGPRDGRCLLRKVQVGRGDKPGRTPAMRCGERNGRLGRLGITRRVWVVGVRVANNRKPAARL
jgi:hypothetical protein